ncbi:MAG: peptidase U32 family protein, partial [Candidatus Alcyoniella australis]|nr:peptidase U32 family protein [Candidatus Alcyoniella australis]
SQVAALLRHGADAIYFGVQPPTSVGQRFSLLPTSVEFDLDSARQAMAMINDTGRRCYVTLNSIYHDEQLPVLLDLAGELVRGGVGALIVSDAGLAALLQRDLPQAELHVSILGRTLNHQTAEFWKGLGASRIILERILSLDEALEIKRRAAIEIELFVYGGFCFNYHGQCRLSSYLYGEMCLAPCRDALLIERMPGAGRTPMRSRCLNAYPLLQRMFEGGVDCIKVEGRQKSVRYSIEVLKVLRRAVDALAAGDPLPPQPQHNPLFIAAPRSTPGFYAGSTDLEQTLELEGDPWDFALGLAPYLSPKGISFAVDRTRKVARAFKNARRLPTD